jgi:hypothetical protein
MPLVSCIVALLTSLVVVMGSESRFIGSNGRNTKPTSIAEYDAILKSANIYVEGIQTGNLEHFRKGFHPAATMYGWLGNSFEAGSAQALYDLVIEQGPTPGFNSRMTIISSTPTTAIVEVDTEHQGEGYRDFLIMCKVDGKWQTVSKVFHAYGSLQSS